ncbi:hypothetical protein FNV43_RR02369 [Rhamnella rubrinervis]|uniref:Uncharacterized protein n=1 Tax=Rhamnella rubrinervis TaxID=2594499 RepID=A0A8K0HRD0_9ROSA|nr:hypothetical protein FNV43_RR02369 [Rhamnella rubrinervis]
MPVCVVTLVRESSAGSCEGRISQKGDGQSTAGGHEEDSMGTDDYIPRGYKPEPRDPEDFDPWDEYASD